MSFTSTDSNHNESPADDNGSDSKNRWEGNALKKGPWSSAEDGILIDYVNKHGEGNWNAVQKHTGLFRCGKSCRLRWANHLRPNLKKGAFSQEEEQLIIELHAKMGNRWARMAAHLPGRTDNEIKNYWNTRIKRRQRAGLPLYPPEMHVEVLDWSQEFANSEIMREDRRHQDFVQLGSFETNVFFDSLNFVTDVVPSASDLADMTACKILGSGASSPRYENFMPAVVPSSKLSSKRLWESELLFPGCSSTIYDEFPSPEQFPNTSSIKISKTSSFSVPCEVEHPIDGYQHSSVKIPDSHTLTDGIVPTSKPSFGAMKLELPSFQYSEATYDQWKTSSSPSHSDLLDPLGTYVQSPPPPMQGVESDCFSNCDTGLLDMLLLEAKIRKNSTKNSLYTTCASTTPSADVAESGLFQIKSEEFDNSYKSTFYSEISISTHNADESQQRQSEKERNPVLDITRPDVLLASSWLGHGLGIAKDTGSTSDALAVFLGDDIGNDYMHMSVAQSAGVGSCSWSNMLPVCQITELP